MGGLAGQLLKTGHAISLGIKCRFEATDRRGAVAQHLPGPAHPLGLELLQGNHLVDQAHGQRLLSPVLAAENAVFGQTGPRVGSFDGGFGASYLARVVGQRKAREIWFLCRQYGAEEALAMGLVNQVVPLADLEAEGVRWAREVLGHSPTAIRCLKAAFNAETDGMAGLQELAGQATHLFYRTAEGQEGRNAFLEKRPPDFSASPWLP